MNMRLASPATSHGLRVLGQRTPEAMFSVVAGRRHTPRRASLRVKVFARIGRVVGSCVRAALARDGPDQGHPIYGPTIPTASGTSDESQGNNS